jgi:hypothetical protein
MVSIGAPGSIFSGFGPNNHTNIQRNTTTPTTITTKIFCGGFVKSISFAHCQCTVVQAVQNVQVVQSSSFAGFVQIVKTVFLPFSPFSPGCLLPA